MQIATNLLNVFSWQRNATMLLYVLSCYYNALIRPRIKYHIAIFKCHFKVEAIDFLERISPCLCMHA